MIKRLYYKLISNKSDYKLFLNKTNYIINISFNTNIKNIILYVFICKYWLLGIIYLLIYKNIFYNKHDKYIINLNIMIN